MLQILKDNLSTLSITLPIAVIFSSFTLFLIDSSIKFFLFGFEILSISVIFLLLTSKASASAEKSRNRFSLRRLGSNFNLETVPSLFLMGIAAVLLILFSYRIDGGIIQLFFAMSAACILVGYAALNILGLKKYFSKLEFYVVSFLASIGITAFLSIGLNFSGNAGLGLSISFLVIGGMSLLITIVTNGKRAANSQPGSLSRSIDVFAITVCVGFYLLFTAFIYPNAASLIASDISRHFADSATLVRDPSLYTESFYLLFHSFQGSIFLLAGENQSTLSFLSSFAFINAFLPLSVYVAARRFLGFIDARIPGLAVMFFTFLSNLSFIYFATLHLTKLGIQSNEYALIVREVGEKSYFGVVNLLQPFVFAVPLTISVIGWITIFSMLRNASIPKNRYIGLFSFIIASLCLIHIPEIALFGLLISLFSILYSKTFVRSRDSLIATGIGFFIAMISYIIIDILVFERDEIFPNKLVLGAFLLPIITSIIALVWDYKNIKLRLVPRYLYTLISKGLEGITVAILVLYMIGIVLWFFIDDFKTSPLIGIGVVPTFLYPVILGIVGLLAIFSIRNLKNQDHHTVVLFLLFSILFLFIMGKVISFISINFVQMPYWEKRMPSLMFVFASMLAPIPLIYLWDRIRVKRRNMIVSTTILSVIVACIFLTGYSSLATQMEYWYIGANGPYRLDLNDIDAIEAVKRIIDKQPSSATISPSEFSRHALSFTTSAYQLPRQDILFSSKLPEVPLMILGGLPYDRIYLYIHDRDLGILDAYSGSWLSKHLLPSLPLLYENEQVRIYNASGLKFPQSGAETAVTIPVNALSDKWLNAYDAVAKSSQNFTEVLDQDWSSFGKYNSIIFTTDPVSSLSHFTDFTSKDISNDFWKMTGQWEQKNDGLHGFGNYSNAARNENLLISDFTTDRDNITFSTLFKIDDRAINRESTTYTAFIMPWKDQTDFDMAGVAFKGDNIYAYFATVLNSKVTFYPQFPYSAPLVTGLKWDGGSVINMTINRSGDVEDLYINGTKFLSRPTTENNPPGFVGIGTFGADNIIFKDFRVSTKDDDDASLSFHNYYDYVVNGGNLIVYNTNGYGAIFDMLNERRSVASQKIPEESQLVGTGSSTSHETKTNFSSSSDVARDSQSDINIIETELGEGNIKYLDIYSLINDWSISDIEKSAIFENITNSVLEKDYQRTDFNYRKIPMVFQNMQAEGNLYMNTSLVTFPSGVNAELVGIKDSDNSIEFPSPSNLTWIKFSGYNNASIRLNNVTLPGSGGGMYVDLILGTDQTIILDFDQTSLTQAGTSNGSQIKYENVTSIALRVSQPTDIVARTPVINLDGYAHFGNLYGGILTGIAGENGIFNGKISFSILASDTYTLADNASFIGKFDTVSIKHNEFSPLITSTFDFDISSYPPIVVAILAILLALAAVFLLYKRIF